MMICFDAATNFWQVALLVFSQLTLISFVISIVILYKKGCKTLKLAGVVVAFLLNAGLYILMQLNSRITGAAQGMHLHIPYGILLIVVVMSLGYNLWALISETNWQKTINRNSIREAFDNLPTGVCFFNDAGLAILCNKAMQRFSFSVCGRDVQIITDIEECFSDDFAPMDGVVKDS